MQCCLPFAVFVYLIHHIVSCHPSTPPPLPGPPKRKNKSRSKNGLDFRNKVLLMPLIYPNLVSISSSLVIFSQCRRVKTNYFQMDIKTSVMKAEYTECQAFSPVVRTGSPAPTSKRVLPSPPFGSGGGGGTLACGRGDGGGGGANSDEGTDTLVL